MDFNPFKENSNFVGLLNSQQNVPFGNFTESVSQSSPQVPVLDSHGEEASEKCKERRTWTPSDDVQLISSWLNTSKDPVVGNEQRSSAFWTSLQSTHSYLWSYYNLIVSACSMIVEFFIHALLHAKLTETRSTHVVVFFCHGEWLSSITVGETPTYPENLFRRRFRMNMPLFMHIVDRLLNKVPFFRQKKDGLGRLGLSTLQKCTAAIRLLAYGMAADAVDEYLRLGETTTRACLENFVEGIIFLFGDEYLRRPTPADLQRLLDIGAHHGFPGMIGSIDCTLNDINVLDRSPVFDEIIKGQAPQVTYSVNGREYHLVYYLTNVLFAQRQEAVRKDVERAFGVLQARFAIVKNPSLFWDKVKIEKIMRACIILHNMIVEDKRDGYTQFDVSEFLHGEDNTSSHVDLNFSTDIPTNIANMMGELDEKKKRLKEIDDEAAALREMQAKVEKDMGPQAKPYQALTDLLSRENFEKYGHPDGRQAGNFSSSVYSKLKRRIWWATVAVYSWFMYSLAASGRLHLPLEIIKAELLIHIQLTRESSVLSPSLQSDFRRVLVFAPRLLEDLMKMAVIPLNEQGHGWLSPALGVIELSQCTLQVLRCLHVFTSTQNI
uniref:DDE Tnp4 domain-containing protein n=1 Tax=Brassica oleracea var. oleracea TaxID=109376 RepID=A0A0D3C144_BRAOL